MISRVFKQIQKSSKLNNNLTQKSGQFLFSSEQNITLNQVDRIAFLTLSNPKKRNPLKFTVIEELQQHLKNIQEQFESKEQNLENFAKCIVIQSEGPVFSAGHDLKELASFTEQQHLELFTKCSEVMQSIQQHPLPVIAGVQGLATAAGCQLVASCDMAIGSYNSKYQTPGIKIGLFCTTPAVPLVRSLNSKKKAMEMLCTGDPIDAQEAYQFGLLNKVVNEQENFEEEIMKFAKRITCYSSETIQLGKSAFYKQSSMPEISDAYDYACKEMVKNLQQEDCKEGVKAFTEKRHPHFKY